MTHTKNIKNDSYSLLTYGRHLQRCAQDLFHQVHITLVPMVQIDAVEIGKAQTLNTGSL